MRTPENIRYAFPNLLATARGRGVAFFSFYFIDGVLIGFMGFLAMRMCETSLWTILAFSWPRSICRRRGNGCLGRWLTCAMLSVLAAAEDGYLCRVLDGRYAAGGDAN